jgi:tetraacyldisaccharide 4'-kinase
MLWTERPALARLLLPLAWLYRLGWALARLLRRAPAWRAPVPVISVGNLSVGGTGKSPLVRLLALRFRARRPAVLLRGYRAQAGPRPLQVSAGAGPLVPVALSGDEAREHAEVRGVAVWIGSDRRASAEAAVRAGAGLLLLDDGFQRRWQLARDLDLLLADWGEIQAGERLLPAGPWREPWSQAPLADALLLSGAPADLTAGDLAERLPQPWSRLPVFRLDIRVAGLRGRDGRRLPLARLRGRRVAALSGLGRPLRFEASLRALGAEVVPWRFPDHHAFRAVELAHPPAGVEALLCTRKDFQRLPSDWRPNLPVWILEAEARVSPAARFNVLLRRALLAAASPETRGK